MSKLWALFDVLRKGAVVADPKGLKDKGGLTLALTALLWALFGAAKEFGYDTHLTQADAAQIAGTVALVVGMYVNYASSDKVGLLPEKPVPPDSGVDVVRPEPARAEPNPVEQYEQQYPRDTGGGG